MKPTLVSDSERSNNADIRWSDSLTLISRLIAGISTSRIRNSDKKLRISFRSGNVTVMPGSNFLEKNLLFLSHIYKVFKWVNVRSDRSGKFMKNNNSEIRIKEPKIRSVYLKRPLWTRKRKNEIKYQKAGRVITLVRAGSNQTKPV